MGDIVSRQTEIERDYTTTLDPRKAACAIRATHPLPFAHPLIRFYPFVRFRVRRQPIRLSDPPSREARGFAEGNPLMTIRWPLCKSSDS